MPPKRKTASKATRKDTWRKAILKAKQGRKTFSMIVGPTYIRALRSFCK
jgi:hypothetical protein